MTQCIITFNASEDLFGEVCAATVCITDTNLA